MDGPRPLRSQRTDVTDQNAPDTTPLRDRIDRYLRGSGLADRSPRVVPLTGDASDRRYFRVILGDGESVILAVHAGPIDFGTLPFANVADLLERMPLPVPEILGHSDAEGIVEQSDLGDATLQAHLVGTGAPERTKLYKQAVDLIELMQRRGRELTSERYLPYRVAFDAEKLTWELDFFVRHFIESYRANPISADDRRELGNQWQAIVGELASEPRVLCHRDYHSRNLMCLDGQLYLIDFQDARMGPDTYDLVSLLRDSYVHLTDREVDDLIVHFLMLKQTPASSADEFRRRFDLMSLQRNLKALGTFGYQTVARGNTVYVQYMPRTLHHVRTNLWKYPRFARLRTLLSASIEELR
jgi:N-acetylmuramate 1-kinase